MDPLTESLTLQSHLPPDFLAEALRADVTRGLTATPKALPPKWFYDERGSVLFDQITRLPEYYPTRAEREILAARGPGSRLPTVPPRNAVSRRSPTGSTPSWCSKSASSACTDSPG